MSDRTHIPATSETAPVFAALAWERIHADDMLVKDSPETIRGSLSGIQVEEVLTDGGLRVSIAVRLPDAAFPPPELPVVDLFGDREYMPRWPGRITFILDFWSGSDPLMPVEMTQRGVPEHRLGHGYQRYSARLQRQALVEYRAWFAKQRDGRP